MRSYRLDAVTTWLERVDPGTHRRIKGLRLITAYGIAVALGTLHGVTTDVPNNVDFGALAGGFALWASVSEGRSTRFESSRDLVVLCAAAAAGASLFALLSPLLDSYGRPGTEALLVSGAFLAPYLKRFGLLGAGVGSQIYIGQLLAFSLNLSPSDLGALLVAAMVAMVAAIVPRVLSGPGEHPSPFAMVTAVTAWPSRLSAEFAMGLQAASAALVVVILDYAFHLRQPEWAITACVYVVAGTTGGTVDRVRKRIVGTLVGVPLGLLLLPLASDVPLVIWASAAIAMIVYAVALPERYDVACGAFAFTLVVTIAAAGEYSLAMLLSRTWETILGGALGIFAALLLFPLRPAPVEDRSNGSAPRLR